MSTHLEIEFIDLLEEHQNILHKICKLYASDTETHKDLFQEMVIHYFIFRFFMLYRRIRVNDSVKSLMENIIHTRRVGENYIKPVVHYKLYFHPDDRNCEAIIHAIKSKHE